VVSIPRLPKPPALHTISGIPHSVTSLKKLDHLVKQAGLSDGFEGNAQGFRIVIKLATSDARSDVELPIPGPNMTRSTLNGILKYPWLHGKHPKPEYATKWGVYDADADIFNWARQAETPKRRSLVAEIMDCADDITFAIAANQLGVQIRKITKRL